MTKQPGGRAQQKETGLVYGDSIKKKKKNGSGTCAQYPFAVGTRDAGPRTIFTIRSTYRKKSMRGFLRVHTIFATVYAISYYYWFSIIIIGSVLLLLFDVIGTQHPFTSAPIHLKICTVHAFPFIMSWFV